MRFDLASPEDDGAIRRLLRETPMSGRIRVTLEREPESTLAGTIEGEVHQVLLARDEATGRAVAMGSRSLRTVWLDGRPEQVGYLSQLRIARPWQGRAGLVRQGYRSLRRLHDDGATRFYVTTIVSDNRPALRLLEAGLDGFPTYRYLETLITLVIEVRRRGPPVQEGLEIERGSVEALPEIVACLERFGRRHQLCPRWTEQDLRSEERTRSLSPGDFYLARRDGVLVGCLARWDQRGFKQVVVQGYQRPLAAVRPLWNLTAPWLGVPRLPPPGCRLRTVFLSHLAADGTDDERSHTLRALLGAARDDARRDGIDYLTLGFARRHPLLAGIRREWPRREYSSRIYLVHWEDGASAVGALGGRLPHLEVAVL